MFHVTANIITWWRKCVCLVFFFFFLTFPDGEVEEKHNVMTTISPFASRIARFFWTFAVLCPIRHRGAGALPAASGDSAQTAAGGEAAESRHHAFANRSQPHTGEQTHTDFLDPKSSCRALKHLFLLSCTSVTTTGELTSTTSKRPWTCWST